MTYPTCDKCGKSILHHRLVGTLAYCDPKIRSVETRTRSFTVTQINNVHRVLGHSISSSARDAERKERVRRNNEERE